MGSANKEHFEGLDERCRRGVYVHPQHAEIDTARICGGITKPERFPALRFYRGSRLFPFREIGAQAHVGALRGRKRISGWVKRIGKICKSSNGAGVRAESVTPDAGSYSNAQYRCRLQFSVHPLGQDQCSIWRQIGGRKRRRRKGKTGGAGDVPPLASGLPDKGRTFPAARFVTPDPSRPVPVGRICVEPV